MSDVPEEDPKTGLQVLEELAADMLQCMQACELLFEQQKALRAELVQRGLLPPEPGVAYEPLPRPD